LSYDESKVEKKKEGLSQMPRQEEKEKEKLEGGREGERERVRILIHLLKKEKIRNFL